MNLILLERETGRVLGQIAILNLYPTMEQYVIRMTHGDITIELLPRMDGWRTCVGIIDQSEFEHLASREDFTSIGPQNRCPDCEERHEPRGRVPIPPFRPGQIDNRIPVDPTEPIWYQSGVLNDGRRYGLEGTITIEPNRSNWVVPNPLTPTEELNDEEEEEVPPPNRD